MSSKRIIAIETAAREFLRVCSIDGDGRPLDGTYALSEEEAALRDALALPVVPDTGAEFHQYLVKLAMEAWDALNPVPHGYDADTTIAWRAAREAFRGRSTERMSQAATVFTCEVEIATREAPKTTAPNENLEQAALALDELAAHLRSATATKEDLLACLFTSREASRIFARLAGVPYDESIPTDAEAERAEAHERGLRTEPVEDLDDDPGECALNGPDDELMDGDHASALESAYGPDNDPQGVDEDYE